MTLSNFRIHVLGRILLIVALITLLVICLYKTHWIVTPFVLVLITGLAIISLIRYVERTNREFADFLLSVKSSDFSRYQPTDKRGRSFSAFKEALNIITEEFQATRIDKETQYIFLQAVVQHLTTAVISFDEKGEVKLVNKAAKDLLHIPFLRDLGTLQKIHPKLYEHMAGADNQILETEIQDQHLKLLVRSASFRLHDIEHKLVLIQNIKPELERKEIEAWEQLLHVLTHEIMNSITPISSLSATIKNRMTDVIHEKTAAGDDFEDMLHGLQVIENRSDGLINFVHQYKSLITIPQPDLQPIDIGDIFDRVQVLSRMQLSRYNINLQMVVRTKGLAQHMDEGLIEQVLLNLVNNAADALEGVTNPMIELSAEQVNDRMIIRVTDNGPGIDRDMQAKIFIPFFTTKKKGTGVGLSLSRQIMQLHNGSISVSSAPGQGAIFSLEFPY